MNFTHFIFAFYVFLLVCGAIWFYGRVMRAEGKKDKGAYEKEHRLFVMYQNVEDMLDSFEEYAEEARSGIDKRLSQVESLIEDLRRELESRSKPQKKEEPVAAEPAPKERQQEAGTLTPPIEGQEEMIQTVPAHNQQKAEPAPAEIERPDVEKPPKSIKSPSDKPKPKTPDLIQQYAEQGMNKEEIAKALGISKREVSLIMEIKKINV